MFDDILTLQPVNLFNSFTKPKKNIKLMREQKTTTILLSFMFYLSLIFLSINTIIAFVEGSFNIFYPLIKLSFQYLLFSILFSLIISFFRMNFFNLVLNILKIKHSKKFNDKIRKKSLVYYLNSFFMIGIYFSFNLYIAETIPLIDKLIWGLIAVLTIYQILQSIYLSYLPYYKKKKEIRNYLIFSSVFNFIFIFGLYVFILNPFIKAIF